jgi:hypothetical protein
MSQSEAGAMYYSSHSVSPSDQLKDFICESLGYRKILDLLKEQDQDTVYLSLQVINALCEEYSKTQEVFCISGLLNYLV